MLFYDEPAVANSIIVYSQQHYSVLSCSSLYVFPSSSGTAIPVELYNKTEPIRLSAGSSTTSISLVAFLFPDFSALRSKRSLCLLSVYLGDRKGDGLVRAYIKITGIKKNNNYDHDPRPRCPQDLVVTIRKRRGEKREIQHNQRAQRASRKRLIIIYFTIHSYN